MTPSASPPHKPAARDEELRRRFTEADTVVAEAIRTLRPDAIDRAIQCLLDLETDLRPNVPPNVIGNLASLRLARFDALGEQARKDLDLAVKSLETLVATENPDDPDHLIRLGALARALRTSYDAGGPDADLDEAIRRLQTLVDRSPEPGLLSDALADLSEALRQRWERDGEEADLEAALEALRRAEGQTSDPLRLARVENRLGAVLSRGFEVTGDRRLLTRAIQDFEASIRKYPKEAPGRTEPMNNLAMGLQRLARLDQSADPDEAAAHLDQAVAIMRELIATPGQPPVPLAENRHNLAVFLLDRYAAKRAAADLEEAEKMLALALSEPGVQGASRLTFLFTKGELELDLYQATRDDAHAVRAAAAYDKASRSRGSMQISLAAARALGSFESERGDWPAGAEAYRRAVYLAKSIFRGLAKRETKEAWLQAVAGLPQAAAVVLANAGDPAGAVEVLEQTRTMILAERLGLRDADLDALRRAGHGELADRYATAMAAWDVPALDSAAEVEADAVLDTTVAEIRSIPGFERFLETPVIDDLRALPPERPVVFLAIGAHGGVALVTQAGTTRAVPLPAFDDGDDTVWDALMTYAQAYDARRHDFAGWLSGLERLTGWMGDNIMGPVIVELRGVSSCTLVPTGILSLLPWHAAWMRIDGKQVHAGDLLAVAYAPSARALLAARHPTKRRPSLVAVEEPQPVSQERLPAASFEVEAISEHFSPVVRLAGEAASAEAALDALRDASCAHFACHGVAVPMQPANSFLLMARDEPLSVRSITGRRGGLIAAELVVLSACETALPGTLAPDEVVNLPTAFLEQGAAAVIGSLWVAPDTATALLMTRLYWNWREAGHLLPEALQEAQRWLRNATNDEIAVWLRSAGPNNNGYQALAEIRRDKPASDRPYANPAYWAAFIYLGR